jgi:branched-chain amino acid aminotransferase
VHIQRETQVTDNSKIWFNGKLRDEAECTVHILSHALHYGSSVFEGIRAYSTPDGPAIFRLTDHLKRLYYSAEVYRIPIRFELQELQAACRDAITANGLEAAYLRPLVSRGNSGLGVIPHDLSVVDVAVIAQPWGAYLGEDGIKNGVKACFTSWQRLAPNTIPPGVKAGGNYLSSQLIGMEARERGFAEGIALGTDGLLSEGAGENLFIVQHGRLLTPPASASILSGITRHSVITMAKDMGLEVVEQSIAREQVYAADEVFMTGTAVEVTPVKQVDHMTIGEGGCGPITRELQDTFFGLFSGQTTDQWGWLEPVN